MEEPLTEGKLEDDNDGRGDVEVSNGQDPGGFTEVKVPEERLPADSTGVRKQVKKTA